MGTFVIPPSLLLQGWAGNLDRAARALDDARAAINAAAPRARCAEAAFLQAEDAAFAVQHIGAAAARGAMDEHVAAMLVAVAEPVMAAMGMVGALIASAPPAEVAQATAAALRAAAHVLRAAAAAWDDGSGAVGDAAPLVDAAGAATLAAVDAAAAPAVDVAVVAAVSGAATALTRAVRAAQVAATCAAEVGR